MLFGKLFNGGMKGELIYILNSNQNLGFIKWLITNPLFWNQILGMVIESEGWSNNIWNKIVFHISVFSQQFCDVAKVKIVLKKKGLAKLGYKAIMKVK